MGGCPCRNSVVAKKRFVSLKICVAVTMFVLVQRSASIHIDFTLVSLRIEPIRAPTKTVTVKRVQVCQMDSGPTNTSVLHLSELISKLS